MKKKKEKRKVEKRRRALHQTYSLIKHSLLQEVHEKNLAIYPKFYCQEKIRLVLITYKQKISSVKFKSCKKCSNDNNILSSPKVYVVSPNAASLYDHHS